MKLKKSVKLIKKRDKHGQWTVDTYERKQCNH